MFEFSLSPREIPWRGMKLVQSSGDWGRCMLIIVNVLIAFRNNGVAIRRSGGEVGSCLRTLDCDYRRGSLWGAHSFG